MIKLIILGVLVLAAVVAYRLYKAKQAVTIGSDVAGIVAVAKTVVADVEKKA